MSIFYMHPSSNLKHQRRESEMKSPRLHCKLDLRVNIFINCYFTIILCCSLYIYMSGLCGIEYLTYK